MALAIYQVDAFAAVAFRGNPAAVCLLQQEPSERWMQAVAAEMNLSETAYAWPIDPDAEGPRYQLRWFTPTMEIDLCGHATLATAHILWQTDVLANQIAARFETRSGLLVAKQSETDPGWIELDFPAEPSSPAAPPADVSEALGVEVVHAERNRFDWVFEIKDVASIPALQPDEAAVAAWGERGVMVTARSDTDGVDFVSRFFGPAVGIKEDPVTGSAHCCLGPYWAQRLDKNDLVGYQASPRGGIVHVNVRGDRVTLAGQAVTTLVAQLTDAALEGMDDAIA